MFRRVIASIAAALVLAIGRAQQPSETAPSQPTHEAYQAFSVVDADAIEQRLNWLALGGYRLAAIRTISDGSTAVFMKYAPTLREPYEYKVLTAPDWSYLPRHEKIPEIQQELNAAGSNGYRFVPSSVLLQPFAFTALVMEHRPGSKARYEYDVFAPSWFDRKDFERKAEGAASDKGFHVVFHGAAAAHPATLMERTSDAIPAAQAATGFDHFIQCKPKNCRKNLEEEIAQGYVPLQLSGSQNPSDRWMSMWFENATDNSLKLLAVDVNQPKDAASQTAAGTDFVNQANTSAAQGYRIAGMPLELERPIGALQLNYVGTLAAVMRPGASGATAAYRLIRTDSLPDLVERVNQAAAEGFVLLNGGALNGRAVLMEKSEAAAQ